MKLAILLILGGWSNPFFGSIQLKTPLCPNSSIQCQISVKSEELYQWEWKPNNAEDWQILGDPLFLSGSELLQITISSNLAPGTLRVKSWRTDQTQIWYSAPFDLIEPPNYRPIIQGNQVVCTGQDIRLKADFPPLGNYQWERSINNLDFSPQIETSKYTRINQAEILIRGSSGVDNGLFFRSKWTSPEGCLYYSESIQLGINQLSTISPTPSTLICEGQAQRLQTGNTQGNWLKNDWFLSDSSGTLRQVVDSSAKTFWIPEWPSYLRSVQVRGWFETLQRVGGNLIKGTCSLTTQRTYSVTESPQTPRDSILTQCGIARMNIFQGGGEWALAKQGPWFKTAGWVEFSQPDTVIRWHRTVNAKGCPSQAYPISYVAHPIPTGTLHWDREVVCFSDTLLPITIQSDSITHVGLKWSQGSIFQERVEPIQTSDTLHWRWSHAHTGCHSPMEKKFVPYQPPLSVSLTIPTEPVCPLQATRLGGNASDSQATWLWSGLSSPVTEQAFDYSFSKNTSGTVQIQNACESKRIPWEITVRPLPIIREEPPSVQQHCLGDSTVWRVKATEEIQVTWYHSVFGKVSNETTWNTTASLPGSHTIWFTWVDACGRTGTSDFYSWIVKPKPTPPLGRDTISLCMGQSLPTRQGTDSLHWWGYVPSQEGEFPVWVKTINPVGCASDSIPKWIRQSPVFATTLVANQSWICNSGLRHRKVFFVNSSKLPIRWLSSGVEETENGWSISKGGTFVFQQTQGWCTLEDSIRINDRVVSPWIELPSSQLAYCPGETPVFSLPAEQDSDVYWYETMEQEMPVHQGRFFPRPSLQPVYIRKRSSVESEKFCESDPLKLEVIPKLKVDTKWMEQRRCEGNTASFEVALFGNGVGQWWQKKPDQPDFELVPEATSPSLRLTSIGNSKHPDQSQYQYRYSDGTCAVQSPVMQLHVLGFKANLSSVEVCEGSAFPIQTPAYRGELRLEEWQTRSGTSGPWLTTSKPEKMDYGTGYWRIRGQFVMENNQVCVQTTDDARVEVNTANGTLKTSLGTCPGDGISYQWTPKQAGGLWSGNGISATREGVLNSGKYVFRSQVKSCQWDTTLVVEVQPSTLPKPEFPSQKTYTEADTLLWKSVVSDSRLVWLQDTFSRQRIAPPIFPLPGLFSRYAAFESEGCLGPVAVWEGKVLTPLKVQTSTLKVLQCEGLSIDLAVKSLGEGKLNYQWYQKSHQQTTWEKVTPWPSKNRGEQTAQLRLYSVGNFPHWDGTWYRCLVSDSLGMQWSDSVLLEVWEPRGSLIPHQYVCENSQVEIDIRRFRGWRPGEIRSFWEKREASGWQEWLPGYQLKLQEQPNGLYRYAWKFPNSKGETCTFTSDDFQIQHVKRPDPPHVLDEVYCQENKSITPAYPTSRFNWYADNENTSPRLSAIPRISLRNPGQITFWLSSRGSFCESQRLPIRWTIHPIPPKPISLVPTEWEGYSLQFEALGENLKWYRTLRSPSQINAPTFTQAGTARFYVTQTNEWGCESEKHLIESRLILPFSILKQPTNLFECRGNMATFQLKWQGRGVQGFQWFKKLPGHEFFPIAGAQLDELKISSVGSTEFPDSSQYVCRVTLANETFIFSDTVSLWVNEILTTDQEIRLCYDEPWVLQDETLPIKGKVRNLVWEGRSGSQWISLGTSSRIHRDSISEQMTLFRARVVFQSEEKETCVRTSPEFKLTHISKQVDTGLPDRILTCDTATRFPIQSNWDLKPDTLGYWIRTKGEQGCWSEWKKTTWEKTPCWRELNDCNTLFGNLNREWTYFRDTLGLVWAEAKGAGTITGIRNEQTLPVWIFQGWGELRLPPDSLPNRRWMVAPASVHCGETSTRWEVLLHSTDVDSILVNSSQAVSYTHLPPLSEKVMNPKVERNQFWRDLSVSQPSWQMWIDEDQTWQEIQFPVDTSLISQRYRFLHEWNDWMYSWIEVPQIQWPHIPPVCEWKGNRLVNHNLHYPLHLEIRNSSGQLLDEQRFEAGTNYYSESIRPSLGQIKLFTFVDRWGRTCVSRQWNE